MATLTFQDIIGFKIVVSVCLLSHLALFCVVLYFIWCTSRLISSVQSCLVLHSVHGCLPYLQFIIISLASIVLPVLMFHTCYHMSTINKSFTPNFIY